MHHMHCQILPKDNIYLIGIPSVLYETPGHIERFVLYQLFLLLFSEKHSPFQWKVQFNEKHNAFQWKVQFHVKCNAFHEKCNDFQWKAALFIMHNYEA